MKTPTTRVAGKAGSHSRSMQYTYVAKLALSRFGMVGLALLSALALLKGDLVIAVAGLVGIGVLDLVARTLKRRIGQTRVGADAEVAAAAAIKASGPHRVILGAAIPGIPGDVDAVVIHRSGIATLEIKAGGGRVRIESGRVVTGKGRVIPGDPLGQATRPANALSKTTGRRVTPILCVQWMSNPTYKYGDVIICSAKDLPRVLRQLGDPVDARTAHSIARGIKVKG